MASFLPHLVIPGLFALAFIPVERKRILAWLVLVWVPDLDYIIPSQHRAVTHSVLVPLALAATLPVLWRRRAPEARFWEFATRPGAPANLLLASFFLASHLALDLFQGGVVLFWPLLNTNFLVYYGIIINTATNEFSTFGDAATSEGAPEMAPEYLWFSPLDAGVTVFLAASLGVVLLAWKRLHGRTVWVERIAEAAGPTPRRTWVPRALLRLRGLRTRKR